MARPPMFRGEKKLRIVLSVLRGEASVAETARREMVSEPSIARWRDLCLEGGAQALADGARRGRSRREVELERRLEQVTSALGEAHVELRLLRGGGRGRFPSQELELMRARAGLSVRRFCALAGIPRASYYRRRDAAEAGATGRSWPAPVRDRIEQPTARLALEWPAWGHRKIWALLEADGFHASQATARRALRSRALLQPPGAGRELARRRKAFGPCPRGATAPGRPTSPSTRRSAASGSWAA